MPPIFLVGVPRSGTTLLSAMLCAHSRLSCGPETHFFPEMTDEKETLICSDDLWPEAALNYLFSIKHVNNAIPNNYEISRNELAGYLRAAPNTMQSVASALPEILMKKMGKERWVEKTPSHLMHGKRIRRHFPSSPIIRIVRDPRDVALSLNNVRWGPQTFLEGIIYWYKDQHFSKAFFETDPLSYTLRYEDLLHSPERELEKLCDFLGESFEKSMLNTAQSTQLVNKTNEPWKYKTADKVDKSRANAWKEVLTEEEKRQADAIIGDYTEERERLVNTLQYVKVHGLYRISSGRDLYRLRKLVEKSNVRFWPNSPNEIPVKSLTVGRPKSSIEQKAIRILDALEIKEFAKKLWYPLCDTLAKH